MHHPDYLLIQRPDDPLEAAIRYFGSAAALAKATGYSPQAVTMWRLRGRVPSPAARAIELASGGQCPAAALNKLGDCGDGA
jgi:DNA-binding transcriptional regulator YdaS (Cro superfamily)